MLANIRNGKSLELPGGPVRGFEDDTFSHRDALSSAIGLKVEFDLALQAIASGPYRLAARRMRGYPDARSSWLASGVLLNINYIERRMHPVQRRPKEAAP